MIHSIFLLFLAVLPLSSAGVYPQSSVVDYFELADRLLATERKAKEIWANSFTPDHLKEKIDAALEHLEASVNSYISEAEFLKNVTLSTPLSLDLTLLGVRFEMGFDRFLRLNSTEVHVRFSGIETTEEQIKVFFDLNLKFLEPVLGAGFGKAEILGWVPRFSAEAKVMEFEGGCRMAFLASQKKENVGVRAFLEEIQIEKFKVSEWKLKEASPFGFELPAPVKKMLNFFLNQLSKVFLQKEGWLQDMLVDRLLSPSLAWVVDSVLQGLSDHFFHIITTLLYEFMQKGDAF